MRIAFYFLRLHRSQLMILTRLLYLHVGHRLLESHDTRSYRRSGSAL